MLESYSESSLHPNHTDNTTVSDKTHIGSTVYRCSRKNKKAQSETENRNIPLKHREKEKPRTSLNNN